MLPVERSRLAWAFVVEAPTKGSVAIGRSVAQLPGSAIGRDDSTVRTSVLLTRTQKVVGSDGSRSRIATDVFGSRRNARGVGDRWGTSKPALLTLRLAPRNEKPR